MGGLGGQYMKLPGDGNKSEMFRVKSEFLFNITRVENNVFCYWALEVGVIEYKTLFSISE